MRSHMEPESSFPEQRTGVALSDVKARRQERLTLETRVLLFLWFAMRVVSSLGLATKAFPLLFAATAADPFSWPFLQALAFVLILAADLSHTLLILQDMTAQHRKLSDCNLTDRALLTATLLAPWLSVFNNSLVYRWGPKALGQSWPAWFAHYMLLVPTISRMPPAHTVLQFLLQAPVQLYNDYQMRCHNPSSFPETCLPAPANLTEAWCMQPPPTCCSSASFASYMAVQCPLLLAAGLLAGLIPIATYVQFPPAPPQDGHGQADFLPASPLPFQTFTTSPLPFSLLAKLGRLHLLDRMESWATWVLHTFNIDAHVLTVVTLAPLVFYYSAFSVLARHGLVSFAEVKPDVWILVLISSVAVGRSSNHLETTSILQYLKGRVSRSVDVLTDVFPDHVVRHLLNARPRMQAQDAYAPSPPRSSAPGSHSEAPGAAEHQHPHHRPSSAGAAAASPKLAKPPSTSFLNPTQASSPEQYYSPSHTNTLAGAATSSVLHGLNALHCPASLGPDQPPPAPPSRLHHEPSGLSAEHDLLMLSTTTSSVPSTPYRNKRLTSVSGAGSQPRLSPRLSTIPDLLGVAQCHDCVTVLFSDLCGFSSWASRMPPAQVMETLNDIFTRLDNIILYEMPTLYKVETIGDAYVVAANLCTPDVDHAATAVRFALRAQEEAAKVLRPDCDDGSTLQMRIGLHSGPIMSGVVGTLRRRFCMFGDTVNMGARTETSCPIGGVQLTAATYELAAPVLAGQVLLIERGDVEVKGSDVPLKMYLAMYPEFEGSRTPDEWMPLSEDAEGEAA